MSLRQLLLIFVLREIKMMFPRSKYFISNVFLHHNMPTDLINDVNLEMEFSEHSAEDLADARHAFQSLIVSGKKLCL